MVEDMAMPALEAQFVAQHPEVEDLPHELWALILASLRFGYEQAATMGNGHPNE